MALPPFAVIADAHILDAPSIQCQHLELALAQAAAKGAEFVILAGDLVRAGRRPAFEALESVLERSPVEWLPICGNRDLYGESTQPYRSRFGHQQQVLFRGGYRLVLLDGHAPGLGPAQTRWLNAALRDTSPHPHTIVFGHHYLSLFPERERNAFLSLCRRYGVRHYVSAHRHLNRRVQHPALTEYVVGAIDPDKSVAGPPCFLLAHLGGHELHTATEHVTIPPEAVRRFLLDQLGAAPARWGCASQIRDLCSRTRLKWYQLRVFEGVGERSLRAQAEVARGCGMRIVGHLPTPAIAPDGTLSNSETMATAIGFCIEHGTEVVVLHPPKLDAALLADHHGRLRTGSPAVEGMVDHFTAMVARMEAAGITVAVENNSSKTSTTRFGSLPAHIVALNNLLAVRGLHPGFCFDIGHAKASVANAQIAEWMGALGHSLAALHLHTGNPHTRITHSPIEELYGRTQWYGVAAWLALLQVEVPCLLEVRTPEDALRSARMLRRLVEER